jgi:glycosyltransferase involved in cell wall biosynthesis
MSNPEPQAVSVAVIVPTRNSAATLQDCLISIRLQTVQCTLVVVDNGSEDSTLSVAREFADLVLECGPERSAQRNAGAQATNEGVIGFIDSDMVLDPNVIEDVLEAFHRGATTVVVPEFTIGEGFWARVSAYERSFYVNNEAIEAPRFFTRTCFEDVGGFDEAMTGAEDWDMGLRTIGVGLRLRTTAMTYENMVLKH